MTFFHGRPHTLLAAAGLLVIVGLAPVKGHPPSAAASVSSISPPDCINTCTDDPSAGGKAPSGATAADCVKYAALRSVVAIRPDGTNQPAVDGDGLGRLYTYDLNGSEIPQSIPAPSWDPLTASASDLFRYGFPKRPTDLKDLQAWTARVTKLKQTKRVASDMCETNQKAVVTNIANSPNWAGGMSINNSATVDTYTSAESEFYQTGFDYACPSTSAYGTWSGLGGYNKDGLMQAGTLASLSSLNGIFPFWEMLDSAHENPAVAFVGNEINPGDDVDSYTSYDPGSRTVVLDVADISTGLAWSVGPIASYAGDPTSSYYDGTTVDYITEATFGGSAPGGYYYLRKPHLGTTYTFRALPNGTDLQNFDSWRFNELNANLMQTSDFDGVHAWSDTWVACS